MTIDVKFNNPQEIHRILHLVHRDLARVRGNILMAGERLEANRNRDPNQKQLPGSVRKQAEDTLRTGPEQQRVLEGAQEALRDALAKARERGEVG